MSKRDFLDRLEQLLIVLPQEEREEAIRYYNDYFEDAGLEKEEQVLHELGSAEEAAARIRAGFAGEHSEYSELGYEDVRFQDSGNSLQSMGNEENIQDKEYIYDSVEEAANAGKQYNSRREESQRRTFKNSNLWKIIALVLLCLIAIPIILPFGLSLLAVLFSMIIALFAVLMGIGLTGIALTAAGIFVIGAGIVKLFAAPPAGLLIAGIGCLLFAIGLLLSLAIGWGVLRFLPWLIRGIVEILRYPLRKAGVIE